MNSNPEILVVDEGNVRSRRLVALLEESGFSVTLGLEPPRVIPERTLNPTPTSITTHYDCVSPRHRSIHTLTLANEQGQEVFKLRGTSRRRAKKLFCQIRGLYGLA